MIKKIFRSIFLVAMAVLCSSFLLIFSVLYQYFTNESYHELKLEAHYIEQGIATSGMQYLQTIQTAAGDTHRVTWIDGDGTVLFDSEADETEMPNHADREEFRKALDEGSGQSSRYSATLSERTIYYAVLLEDGTVLRVSETQNSIVSLLLGMLYPVIVVLMLAFVLSLVLAWNVSKRVVKPLNEIDLEHPEDVDTYEELVPMLTRIVKQNHQIRSQMQELSQKREEFNTITENMREGLLIINQKMEILSYNSSALSILDAKGHVDGQNALVLNRSEVFRNAIASSLKGQHEEQLMRLGTKCYQLMVNPVYQDQNVAGAVIMILDVTEKEEREQLRREFTANVSHELKTPLTSISGFAEIIKNGMVQSEDISHFAGRIYEEAQRLITLVQDIMRLSQLDEDKACKPMEPVELGSLANAVVQRLAPEARRRNIQVQVDAETVVVLGDRSILDEVIYNLVDNAIKYNREGGTVTVTVSGGTRPVLSVKDTGIGIPVAEQSRVFERFYRVDKSHSKQIGGTGLGLSIVKHGIAYHGANLELHSEEGQGTEVIIHF